MIRNYYKKHISNKCFSYKSAIKIHDKNYKSICNTKNKTTFLFQNLQIYTTKSYIFYSLSIQILKIFLIPNYKSLIAPYKKNYAFPQFLSHKSDIQTDCHIGFNIGIWTTKSSKSCCWSLKAYPRCLFPIARCLF